MQTEFALIPRISLCLAVSVLAACGGDGTKPEWSQVVYTDTPQLVVDEDHEQPYYVYPLARSVMPQVFPRLGGYGIPLSIERADFSVDPQFLSVDAAGKVTHRGGDIRRNGKAKQSASGLWVHDESGPVVAFNAYGTLLWQRTVSPGEVTNTTGSAADFISARQTWRENDGTPGGVETLVLTGLSSSGLAVWQQSFSVFTDRNYSSYAWDIAHDDQGQVCFINSRETPRQVQCLNADGTIGATHVISGTGSHQLDVSNQRIGVISRSAPSQTYTIELLDRSEGLLQSASYTASGSFYADIATEFSSDGQFHMLFLGSGQLLTVSGDGAESVSNIGKYSGDLDDLPYFLFSTSGGQLSADALGNLYVLTEARGQGTSNGTTYRTVRSVVTKRAPNGELSDVVLGHLSKYRYVKDGQCIKRCEGFSGAKVLTDIAAQPDGRLITAWADSSVGLVVGDFGLAGYMPYRRAVIVASYAPAPATTPQ